MLNNSGFDEWSEHYDESIDQNKKGYPFEGYDEVLVFIRHQIRYIRPGSILDIGVGTGLLSHPLYSQGITIWGIDFSVRMIEQTQKKMPKAKLLQWDITRGVPPEIKNHPFDAIISSYAIHHIQEKDQVRILKSYIDCIRPGGMLVVGDVGFPNLSDRERVKHQFSSTWDDDEHYMIGERLIKEFTEIGIDGEYHQISSCAGVLTVKVPI